MKQVLAILLSFIFFHPGPVLADEKIRGKYEVIGDVNKLKGVKTIKMLEFFNYSCGHCYRFLETSKKLRAKFKDKLHHKKYIAEYRRRPSSRAKATAPAAPLGMSAS